ncbi:MAG: riboflavin synthase [Planctomycetes bacterium]|nr:riboflavin synthase [Planctomycetota bacterium]
MFTGIVERACRVLAVEQAEGRRRLHVDMSPLRAPAGEGAAGGPPGPAPAGEPWPGPPGPESAADDGLPADDDPARALVALGDSVAVAGVCLTVAALAGDAAAFDVITQTLAVTSLGGLAPGARVNVERALRFGARLDGHLVQGHVEQTGRVVSRDVQPGQTWLVIDCGREFARRCLPKGSVTVDGVSLTLAELRDDGFAVGLVPHTLERTTLGGLEPGQLVNLEADLVGQWVLRHVEALGLAPR